MKIIAERKWEMKRKTRDQAKGGNNMKKLAMAILVVATLISASNAFAHWKAPASLVLQDPAPRPFDNKNF